MLLRVRRLRGSLGEGFGQRHFRSGSRTGKFRAHVGPYMKWKRCSAKIKSAGITSRRHECRRQPHQLTRSRSKSRAKERDAKLPKPLTPTDLKPPTPNTLHDSLRTLAHLPPPEVDDDNVQVFPLSTISIDKWTRFLSKSAQRPDLGAGVTFHLDASLIPSSAHRLEGPYQTEVGTLYIYVSHAEEYFRLVLPLSAESVKRVDAKYNPKLESGAAVAVRLEVAEGVFGFEKWCKGWEGGEGWEATGDFTDGVAGKGGRCDLTGEREVSGCSDRSTIRGYCHALWTFSRDESRPDASHVRD